MDCCESSSIRLNLNWACGCEVIGTGIGAVLLKVLIIGDEGERDGEAELELDCVGKVIVMNEHVAEIPDAVLIT